ncbi:hypothetical protein MKK70_15530, partial [Methylobacterium sp. E-041]|uniref:hypothetical protein n=1 Tax=Methylobacterium sp. E-041 TaxID=2836573 RepID=UPI001FB9E51E
STRTPPQLAAAHAPVAGGGLLQPIPADVQIAAIGVRNQYQLDLKSNLADWASDGGCHMVS